MSDRFYRWWACDYSPVDGRLRFAVYGILLLLALQGLLDNTLYRVSHCPDAMFEPPGLMTWTALAGLTQSHLLNILLFLKTPLVIVWACSAIGFGGRIPLILTGLGVAFFWGCYQCAVGTGHAWHAPMFLLLIFGFCIRPDRWSVDALIARRFQQWPFAPWKYNGPDLSGYARKLSLLLVMFTLFAGGATKLWQGGASWADGSSLHFYLVNLSEPKTWVGEVLFALLTHHPRLFTFLSIWTVALELGAIITLFSKRSRWPFVLNAWAFHLGIWFLMLPRYWPQMTCYLLLVPWEALRNKTPKQLLLVFSGFLKPESPADCPLPDSRARVGLSLIAIMLSLTLAATIIAQREWFPLTHVPMYSSFVSEERIGDHPKEQYGTLQGLSRIASTNTNDDQPWWIKFEIERKIRLVGVTTDGSSGQLLDSFPGEIVEKYLWTRRISYSLLNDLRKEQWHGNSFSHCQRQFNSLASRILAKPEWGEFITFNLVFVESDGSHRTISTVRRIEPFQQ